MRTPVDVTHTASTHISSFVPTSKRIRPDLGDKRRVLSQSRDLRDPELVNARDTFGYNFFRKPLPDYHPQSVFL